LNDRLPAKVEAAAIMRRVESQGDFAILIKRGDPDRGVITLLVREKGQVSAIIERQLDTRFNYSWANLSADRPLVEADWREFLEKKRKFDPDFWAIELDVADAQRFVAETTSTG
jgi:hypothetical protein